MFLKVIDIDTFVSKWKHLKGRTLYVACSGGVDSVILFHLMRLISEKVNLLHVNYNLRGVESEKDCAFVSELAKEYSVPVFIKEVDTNAYLDKYGGNLQEVARDIRYNFFEEYLSKDKDALLVLGHHADDQVETFFQHLARKSGILGMSCMLDVDRQLIRPLLTYSKEAIYSLAALHNWKWREDSSNLEIKYTRNKLRNEFIPQMEREIPTLKESVMCLVSTFQENQQLLENSIQPIYQVIKQTKAFYFDDFDRLSHEERICLLQKLSYPTSILREIEKLRKSQKGKSIIIQGAEIYRESDCFLFLSEQETVCFPSLLIEEVKSLPICFSSDILYLDQAKLKGELRLRRWQVGDRISPIGMKGSKLISDILTDAKIASYQRKHQLVLVDDEKIIWCVGFRVSRLIQVTETTQKILQVTLRS